MTAVGMGASRRELDRAVKSTSGRGHYIPGPCGTWTGRSATAGWRCSASSGSASTSYGEGWVEATWIPTERRATRSGPVHGGVYAVVHDAAMNFATNTALEKGDRGATISITYSTMRAPQAGDVLAVRGEVVRLARQIAYLETTITNADGELVSKASGHVHPAAQGDRPPEEAAS